MYLHGLQGLGCFFSTKRLSFTLRGSSFLSCSVDLVGQPMVCTPRSLDILLVSTATKLDCDSLIHVFLRGFRQGTWREEE